MKDEDLIRYWAHMLDESMYDKAPGDLGDRSYYAAWAQEFPQYANPERLKTYLAGLFDRYFAGVDGIGGKLEVFASAYDNASGPPHSRAAASMLAAFEPGEITPRKYFWEQIPAQTYRAVVSRNRARAQGSISHEVSPKVLKDCLDTICRSASIIEAHDADMLPALRGTRVYKTLIGVCGNRTLADTLAQDLYLAFSSFTTLENGKAYDAVYDKLVAKYPRESQMNVIENHFDEYNDMMERAVRGEGAGQWLCNQSDSELGAECLGEMKKVLYDVYDRPEEAVLLISRLIDWSHIRGDVSGAFVEGGAKTCAQVSNMGPSELYEGKDAFRRKFGGNPGFDKTFGTYWNAVRRRANGPEKDVEYWQNRTWEEFTDFVARFDRSNRRQRRDAEYVADAKKHGAVLLGKKDEYEAWYVPTFEAAKDIGGFYTGNSGHWCILNRDRRAWAEYTDDFGELFVFLVNVSRSRGDDYNKIALEISGDGELLYVWDNEDESHAMLDSSDPLDAELNLPQDVKSAVRFAMEKIYELADRIGLRDRN